MMTRRLFTSMSIECIKHQDPEGGLQRYFRVESLSERVTAGKHGDMC